MLLKNHRIRTENSKSVLIGTIPCLSIMSVNCKAKLPGYNKRVCFSRRAITNITKMKKITEQYRVIYDIVNNIFIVHKDGAGLQDM